MRRLKLNFLNSNSFKMEKETSRKGWYKSSVSYLMDYFSKLLMRLVEKISITQTLAVVTLEIDRNFWQLNQIQVLKWIWPLKKSLMMTMTAWRPRKAMMPTQKGRPLALTNPFLLSTYNLNTLIYSRNIRFAHKPRFPFCCCKLSVINWFTDLQYKSFIR